LGRLQQISAADTPSKWLVGSSANMYLEFYQSLVSNLCSAGGKLGFYYKDHEILPPLPGGFMSFPWVFSKFGWSLIFSSDILLGMGTDIQLVADSGEYG